MLEPPNGIGGGDGLQGFGKGGNQLFPAPWHQFSDNGFDLGPCLLDWIQVGRVGGKERQDGTTAFDGHSKTLVTVNAQVVPDHNVSRFELGNETTVDPLKHRLAVDRARNNHRSDNPGGSKTSNDTVVRPAVPWNVVNRTFTNWRPGNATSHGQVDPALVDKYQRRALSRFLRLSEPDSRFLDVWAVAFGGVEGLFFRDNPIRRSVRQIVVLLTLRPPCRGNSLTSVSKRRIRTSCYQLQEKLFALPVDDSGLSRWGKRGGIPGESHASAEFANEATTDPEPFGCDVGGGLGFERDQDFFAQIEGIGHPSPLTHVLFHGK